MKRKLLCLLMALILMMAMSTAQAGTGTRLTLGDTARISGAGVQIDGDTLRIMQAGVYTIEGEWTGQIYVECSGQQTVELRLCGVTLVNPDGNALHVEDAGRVLLTLADGTENLIQSGPSPDTAALKSGASNEATGAAVYARDDLTISGRGALTVIGGLNNGIHCTNVLTVESGLLSVTALHHGLKGKDTVRVIGGEISVLSGGDGVQSSDQTGEGFGTVEISGGSLAITAYGDGIQAETALTVSGGDLVITTVGEEKSAARRRSEPWGRGWDRDDEADSPSRKGLKSHETITITGGSMVIDAIDDAIHADASMAISGGSMTLNTQDDGLHAETSLEISGGSILIETCYEGIEANQLLISGGDIALTSDDDGLNAFGGVDMFGGFGSSGGRSKQQQDEEPSTEDEPTPLVRITGGTLVMHTGGDGLDSNGSLVVEGGTVIVHGPTSSMNGAIDTGAENGGECIVHGGTVLAVGASGMAESFGRSSTQASFFLTGVAFNPGDTLVVRLGGEEIFTCEIVKSGNSIVFTDPALQVGDTVTVEVAGQVKTFELTGITTSEGRGGRRW